MKNPDTRRIASTLSIAFGAAWVTALIAPATFAQQNIERVEITGSSIKRVDAETKTKSGIFLPDSAKEKPKRGKVIAVGDGKRLDNGERAPFSVKKGDEVIFTSYAGTEIKLDGEELMIMSEEDILAVVE